MTTFAATLDDNSAMETAAQIGCSRVHTRRMKWLLVCCISLLHLDWCKQRYYSREIVFCTPYIRYGQRKRRIDKCGGLALCPSRPVHLCLMTQVQSAKTSWELNMNDYCLLTC